MSHIAIVYFSKNGVTRHLAQSVIEGITERPGNTVTEYQISGTDIIEGRFRNDSLFDELIKADAIIFGSPTYMGSVAAQFKAFADASSEAWTTQAWAGKLAAGFTCGSSVNGEQTFTLSYFMTLASQHGMLWAGLDSSYGHAEPGINRMGCSLGAVAHVPDCQVHDSDMATARYLGSRVAALANERITACSRRIMAS